MTPLIDRIFRSFISLGRLDVVYSDGTRRTYVGTPGPVAAMRILSPSVERRLIVNPGLAFGEAYMDGLVVPTGCTLYDLLDVLMANSMQAGHIGESVAAVIRYGKRTWTQFNPASRARRNVAHHYDLNGALYDLFLDSDRQYSCAYFPRGDETLEEAQVAKKRHIAAKLRLDRPGLEVLDIGCGWGGMALTLAREYGARVTGITLSEEQLGVARQRARDEGLADRVRFELVDYRAVTRRFDRIVSVGMFEHVGIGHYRQFFDLVANILAPDGVMLLHSIGRHDGPGSTNPWIDRYIFPGGYSPALSETFAAIEKSGLWVTDCEILRLHYAKTIALWRDRFAANRERVAAMYDERFCRMFEFYLAAAELSFRVQGHMNFQLQITRSIDAVPLTRDYMVDVERDAAATRRPRVRSRARAG
ncbi:Cyclopropane-fatty-acyl-phospholipid synthase [Gluconacetobacter diazotrophicus PA1 5]|uniref:Class I SAM-dependent methyltransferase n=2 Tax=Gluconacetobacter diazotrophicus TaxID=33996 RepID=A0A7W4FD45_GLUDI|nr:cyclopropane-fatty-acyl-phospholipid synthase family protein [Gluconacetobacter diazotrophicus]ACI52771.1 Cyclopropane-fatty-acyl-phospholipid synthase [Gluconacetobacter diazotrophicus PA1 5]MBB2155488.1 class I SAM-dependent methyltransferase [Gluconacetobacter diazotrophicus]TWB06104.1 cyclopropane-fatty-acyl-phospholipid synthase [Gluconacetobacter diazotrophicus]CAP57273.1 putative cyclopropane-fatty-acyl-phospholipid synthase [Gluconacetobacter diazotrophicus PA1 5]